MSSFHFRFSSSNQPVGAGAKEIEQAEVPEDLELLADFGVDVPIGGMKLSAVDRACNTSDCGVLWRIMGTLKTVSFRISSEAVETLDALAETMDRDRSYLLNEAVERYLELNEYHIKLIKKGLRAAEAGDFVPDAEMKKLIAKMRRAK